MTSDWLNLTDLLNCKVQSEIMLVPKDGRRTRTPELDRYREYVYNVAVYQKYLTRLGELILCS